MPQPDIFATAWVAADWGSTNLRLWLLGETGEVIRAISDPRGAAELSGAGFEATLRELLAPVLAVKRSGPLEVIACGMLGARQGWAEAAYLRVPAPPVDMGRALVVPDTGADLRVRILPGLRQDDPPDVMRGEETQIGGLIAADPGYDGIVCLPGTHSKWARVTDGAVQSFATCMTGELFALLSDRSVLRHSVGKGAWDDASFDAAAAETLSRPERLTPALFGIRAGALLKNAGPAQGTARLSGLLIGAEIGAMRPVWSGLPVTVLGAKAISDSYARVLSVAGASVTLVDAEGATLRGLGAAYRQMKGHPEWSAT
ncbi:2-dehydro-3-deoxygalactonokinase [Citreimonas sp.]|uniref:2-dehydro-3-deoxygalactonokinase n=1 Tax=Citreimonas sp. TaxID=3036715 RepID=UPI0035C83D3D